MSQSMSPPSVRASGRALVPTTGIAVLPGRLRRLGREMWKHRGLYLLMTPTLIYYLVFKYIPLYNAQIAFKDFKPLLGVEGSPWVGFKFFETFINSFYFSQLITKTLFFSGARLV